MSGDVEIVNDDGVSLGLTEKQVGYLMQIMVRYHQGKITPEDVIVLSKFQKYDELGVVDILLNYALSEPAFRGEDGIDAVENLHKNVMLRLKTADIRSRQKLHKATEQSINIKSINAMLKMNRDQQRLNSLGGAQVDGGPESKLDKVPLRVKNDVKEDGEYIED